MSKLKIGHLITMTIVIVLSSGCATTIKQQRATMIDRCDLLQDIINEFATTHNTYPASLTDKMTEERTILSIWQIYCPSVQAFTLTYMTADIDIKPWSIFYIPEFVEDQPDSLTGYIVAASDDKKNFFYLSGYHDGKPMAAGTFSRH